MKFTEMFGKKTAAPEENTDFPGNISPEFANDAISIMLTLEKEGKLKRTIEEYIESEKFLTLLTEFDAKAAVRIFDAEDAAQKALEQGRNSAIDDIARRRAIPKAIKSAQPVEVESDFSKMSSAEFNKIKKQLERASRR